MRHIYLSLICFQLTLLLAGCTQSKNDSIVKKIADAHGLEQFEELERLQYTFNVRVNDSLRTSRTWIWEPQTGQVVLKTADSSFQYNHKSEADQFEEIDHKFINDQYWFLFPFHLVWDKMEYEHHKGVPAPISGTKMQQLIVKYPPTGGYTPGDVYEVFFGADYVIREWVYRSGGSTENPFATTWEDYADYKGVKIAKTHLSEDGNFMLFFSGVDMR